MLKSKILNGINQQIDNIYYGMTDLDIDKKLSKDLKEKTEKDIEELKQIRDKLEKLLL
jgi:hypothetical protein